MLRKITLLCIRSKRRSPGRKPFFVLLSSELINSLTIIAFFKTPQLSIVKVDLFWKRFALTTNISKTKNLI